MIKAIIFDCFGVLTEDSWHAFRIGLPESLQEPASRLNQQYCRAEISKQAFLQSVAQLTNHSTEEIKQLIDNESNKNHQLLDYIKTLRHEYRIGLLSNVASNWIREYLLTPSEQDLFDAFVFSYEVGITKPDKRIFSLACQKLGVKTGEAIMVDDIDHYCVAAREAGMHTIHYVSFEQFRNELQKLTATTS